MAKLVPQDDYGHSYFVSPVVDSTGKISGQITIAASGTVYQGTDIELSNGVFIKALLPNTGRVYVGDDGNNTVSATTGYELSSGEAIIIQVANLNELYFYGTTSGDKICWIKG